MRLGDGTTVQLKFTDVGLRDRVEVSLIQTAKKAKLSEMEARLVEARLTPDH